MRCGPARGRPLWVATSRPVACLRRSAPLATALLPSTAPEFSAKLTAATAVPVVAMTSATIATTIAGDGRLELGQHGFLPGSRCLLSGTRRARRKVAVACARERAARRDQGPRQRALQGHRPGAADRRRGQRVRRCPSDGPIVLCRCGHSRDQAVLRRLAQDRGLRRLPASRAVSAGPRAASTRGGPRRAAGGRRRASRSCPGRSSPRRSTSPGDADAAPLRLHPRRQPDVGGLRGGARRARGRRGGRLRLGHGRGGRGAARARASRATSLVVPGDGYPGVRADRAGPPGAARGGGPRWSPSSDEACLGAIDGAAPRVGRDAVEPGPRRPRRRRARRGRARRGRAARGRQHARHAARAAAARARRRPLDVQRLEVPHRPQRPRASATSPRATREPSTRAARLARR